MSNVRPTRWFNWSKKQSCVPNKIVYPQDINELRQLVCEQSKIRVVGAGHSFSPLVCTQDCLISLDHIKGFVGYNAVKNTANLYAGTRLFQLETYLKPINQAFMNQGDIDQQSLAGAMSTGTHGTGLTLGCLSSYIQEFELLTASGDFLTCNNEQNTDIFQAGRVGLGALGILTKITMQNRPCYKLGEQIYLEKVDDALENLESQLQQHRHLEFFIFPFNDRLIYKTLNESDEVLNPRPESFVSEDMLLSVCSEVAMRFPALNPYLQKLLGVFIQPTHYVDWSSSIFPTPRETRFNEMEYQVPLVYGIDCLKEIIETMQRHQISSFFPIECRFVKSDDIWLSPFYQQDSMSLSIHEYAKQDSKLLFELIEPIFKKYQARPHWGKVHNNTMAELAALYPKWQNFLSLREQLDPNNKFLNPYLEQMFYGTVS